jgi:hypothetical protein
VRGTAFRAIWLSAALAGCSTIQPRTLRIDSAAGMYQGVTINYRVDGGQLSEPLTVARINGQQVTQERLPSSPYPDRSIVRLSIRYPHPDGKTGYALAEMVVETHKPPSAQEQAKKAVWQQWTDSFAAVARDILPGIKMSDDVYEAWALDISKSDLDRVVQGMSLSGYFVNPSKQTMGVELAVRIDNFQAVKKWTREPELDILLARLRQEGQLVSYVHPMETQSATTGVAYTPNAQGTMLVSHDEAGPSLMPAGPQNNAYQSPPETPRAPQTLPLPSPAIAPQPSAPSYTAPPQYVPPPNYSAPPSANASPRSPGNRRSQPAYPKQPPRSAQPAPNGMPGAGQPTQPNPRSRWQYPQPYRRGATPPGATGTTSPNMANSAAQQNQTQTRGRPTPQQRLRMPWQRGANPPSNAQQAAPSQAPANMGNQDPRRSRMPRYPGAAAGQQPPPGGRTPTRYPRPFGKAPAPAASNANPQTSAGPVGYPAGLPQPPQISTSTGRY